MKNMALGRGLSSLLGEEALPIEVNDISRLIDIELIEVNKDQPRKIFDEVLLKELADSIINHGLVQPIIVTEGVNGKYKIVAGERRYRASKIAGLRQIPAILKALNDKEILEIALIENIQRKELTVIEEAGAYQKLIDDYSYSQVELANILGKSRSHVTNILRLNQLPETVKYLVSTGQLSMGHARCLVGLDEAEQIAAKIVANDLNVRQTEDLVSNIKKRDISSESRAKRENKADEDMILLGHSLSEKFGVKVTVENSWNGGKISFYYSNLQELDSILGRFK